MKKRASAVAILIAAFWLFIIPGEFYAQSSDSEAPERKDAHVQRWENLVPRIRPILKKKFRGMVEEPYYHIAVTRVEDLTGKGGSDALIYLGAGGAYTDYLVLMTLRNGAPVLAKFKEPDGKIDSPIFLSGASVMHSEGTYLLPSEHALYRQSCSANEEGVFNDCGILAYRYNRATGLFEYSRALSTRLSRIAKVPPQ